MSGMKYVVVGEDGWIGRYWGDRHLNTNSEGAYTSSIDFNGAEWWDIQLAKACAVSPTTQALVSGPTGQTQSRCQAL